MKWHTTSAAALMAFTLAACGGGSGSGLSPSPTPVPIGGGTLTPSPTTAPTGSSGSYFIKGTVDGTVRNGTVDVTGSWIDGSAAGNGLTAKTTDTPAPAVWSIQHLKNAVGTYSCNGSGDNVAVVTFSDPKVVVNPMTDADKMQVLTAGGTPKGSCSITVTAASSTEMEGTFTATLKNYTGTYTRTVTNGSFKVAKVD